MSIPAEAATAQVDLGQPHESRSRAGGWRLARRLRNVPAPLVALLAIVLIVGLCWALIVPPFESPDESDHFAYAQSLAERFALPGNPTRPGWSTDESDAILIPGAIGTAHYSDELRFDWSAADVARYRAAFAKNPPRSDGGGPDSATSNPPLYYIFADLAYWATYPGNAFDRLYAMRIWTVSLLLLTVVGAWLLAGEVLGRRRLPQLVCAAAAGLIPMETSLSASVNPDALVIATYTFALWLGSRVIIRGARPRDVIALSAVTAAAILTKATSYALVPAVAFAFFVGWLRCPRSERPMLRLPAAVATLILIGPVLAWILVSYARGSSPINSVGSGPHPQPFNLGQFLSYLWQFYLPRLPWLTPFRTTPDLPVYDMWIREGWGVFGWLEIAMPPWLYGILAGFTAIVAVWSATLVAKMRDRLRLSLVAFFVLALVALLFGLHLTEYRSIIAGQGALLQGRYLLPLVGLFGLAVGLIVSRMPLRWRPSVCGAIVAGLLLLQILALATVTQRYYT
jgi:4-amino-4-deoxy-L-arabinose transferase-like glycosyltransferase